MKHILIVGGGPIGKEYYSIFSELGCKVVILSKETDVSDFNVYNQKSYELSSGYLSSFDGIVIAIQPEKTSSVLIDLLRRTSSPILVEKPVALNGCELKEISKIHQNIWSRIYVAFNRRFFGSVKYVKDILKNDTILGCEFCFTEIEERVIGSEIVRQRWMLTNSIHVFDIATYIAGYPKDILVMRSGKAAWHSAGSNFVGVSRINNGYMNFSAYWGAAGNWEVSFITPEFKYILNPLETVQIQKRGSINRENLSLPKKMPAHSYKAGFYEQVVSFVNQERSKFISMENYYALHDFIFTVSDYDEEIQSPC